MLLITDEMKRKSSVSTALPCFFSLVISHGCGGSHFFSRALASRSLTSSIAPLVGSPCKSLSSLSKALRSILWISFSTVIFSLSAYSIMRDTRSYFTPVTLHWQSGSEQLQISLSVSVRTKFAVLKKWVIYLFLLSSPFPCAS